jgi:hypothetical protein
MRFFQMCLLVAAYLFFKINMADSFNYKLSRFINNKLTFYQCKYNSHHKIYQELYFPKLIRYILVLNLPNLFFS